MSDDEMTPLFKTTEGVVKKFVKKPVSLPPSPKGRPPIPPFDAMRFFIAKSEDRRAVSLVWVDHDAACHDQHEIEDDGSWRRSDWHSYSQYDDYYKRWYPAAIRCPLSITVGTVLEVNTPPGHALSRFTVERAHARDRKQKKQAEDPESFE